MYDVFETIRDFLERGGQVIVVIAWVVFIMWTMILDRLLFFFLKHPHDVHRASLELGIRRDPGSWAFAAIRAGAISRLGLRLRFGIPMIQTLAAVCPLLGLLGTVTGMIVIFDVMAAMGSSSPRSVAAGVAQATMTTMAGMVGALSGVFPAVLLSRLVTQSVTGLQHHFAPNLPPPVTALPSLPWPARLPVCLGLAFVITMGLLYGMQRLIETGEQALTDPVSVSMVDFIRVPRAETLEQKDLRPEQVPPAETQPDTVIMPEELETDPGSIKVNLSRAGNVSSGLDVNLAGLSFESQDGDYLPLVKVQPIYPRRAAARGISGWVVLEFTVNETGAVEDVVVIESSDSIFERAAVQAALRFKYRPRVVDGRPVAVTGVRHLIRFEMLDD